MMSRALHVELSRFQYPDMSTPRVVEHNWIDEETERFISKYSKEL